MEAFERVERKYLTPRDVWFSKDIRIPMGRGSKRC